MKRLKSKIAAWFCRPSNALMVLSASLLALDHSFTNLTLGGLSLAAGAIIIRKADA